MPLRLLVSQMWTPGRSCAAFNGTSWSVAPSLDPGSVRDLSNNTFSAISGVSPHTLFAVGRQDIPDPGFCCEAGLAEHFIDG